MSEYRFGAVEKEPAPSFMSLSKARSPNETRFWLHAVDAKKWAWITLIATRLKLVGVWRFSRQYSVPTLFHITIHLCQYVRSMALDCLRCIILACSQPVRKHSFPRLPAHSSHFRHTASQLDCHFLSFPNPL